MEPMTHMLTGAVLARAGFNRKAAYATWAMAIAAELPDIDVAWSALGPVAGFQHHRGITHTFLGLPIEAALVAWGCRAFYRWRNHGSRAGEPDWWWLYGGCLLALLSHLLLDWTNNYGLRPFFPFNPHWYAGSFVFIFEPVMFLLLLGALVTPALFGLINSEVGARKEPPGLGWAIAALAGVVAMYGYRFVEHDKAIAIATADAPEGTTRVFASPHPITPFAWSTVTETDQEYQLGTVDTRRGTIEPHMPSDTIFKPPVKLALLVAKRSELGEVYLDWSMFPVLSQTARSDDAKHPWTDVTFQDARFMYDVLGFKMRENPAMSGTVTLDMSQSEGHRVIETKMGGRVER